MSRRDRAQRKPNPMTDSETPRASGLYRTVLVLYGIQVAYYAVITWIFSLPPVRLFAFVAGSAGYHALFYAGLRYVRKEFHLEPTGKPLRGANLPLVLTFVRLSAVPAVVFLFLSIRRVSVAWVVAPFLVVVFLTDLFDGLLARKLHLQSRLGRIVDAAGDYLLIFTVTILYGAFGLVPWWLVALVLVRLGLQSGGIITLYHRRGFKSLKLTLLGKASVFSTFCLYGFELAGHLGIPVIGSPRLLGILELVAAGVLAASLVDKILFLLREFRAPAEHRGEASRPRQATEH
jgi:CDP-diacylglycerol--glycerol-3-phosphate 3-phosphatidyltransferase